MKFTGVITALLAAAVVAALPGPDTNAHRLARGLPLLPPVRRGTPTGSARKGKPSGSSGGINNSCNSGPVQCCNSVTHANDKGAKFLEGLLGLVFDEKTAIGLGCSPLSVVGIGGNSCNSQPVCCTGNKFNGLVMVGCSPVNINA